MTTPITVASSRLLLLTDRTQLPLGRSLRAVLTECAGAGLRQVVLRELDLSDLQRAALADHATALGLHVVAARRPVAGCAGVHLAAHQQAGAVGGPWGRSCHSADDVRRAAGAGASWATLSPFARTTSKHDDRASLPTGAFAGHAVPVFALAGVDPANASAALAAGAHGVAVMGAVMRAEHPGAVVAALLQEVGP